jgi:hypothetical protein
MSDVQSGDLPFRDDEDEPTDVPVANPDAVAEADEDQTDDRQEQLPEDTAR